MARFYAANATTYPNGSIGWRTGSQFDCLGPFAKVENCPIIVRGNSGPGETAYRRTAYATDYADTYFSVPAVTRLFGQRIKGYFTQDENGIVFNVQDEQ